MRRAVLSRLDQVTIVIKAAAVADYRPRVLAEQKMKRSGPITLEFEPTEDILREVVVSKRPGTLVIGFAAETENLIEHGRDKLLRKGADAIVLNDVSRPGIGFDSDRNAATFLTPKTAIELPEMTKHELIDTVRKMDEPKTRKPAPTACSVSHGRAREVGSALVLRRRRRTTAQLRHGERLLR